MFRLLSICALCVLARAELHAPGVHPALRGDIAGLPEFELDLRPPEESAQDVQGSLSTLMKSESMRNKASQADFAADKERMLEAERSAIEEIVSSAMKQVFEKS